MRDRPDLADVGRITLLQSLRNVRLTLWDETKKNLISFRQARRLDKD
jgi:omega-6 fatty acid desaturase (delta-12 desaturase)